MQFVLLCLVSKKYEIETLFHQNPFNLVKQVTGYDKNDKGRKQLLQTLLLLIFFRVALNTFSLFGSTV